MLLFGGFFVAEGDAVSHHRRKITKRFHVPHDRENDHQNEHNNQEHLLRKIPLRFPVADVQKRTADPDDGEKGETEHYEQIAVHRRGQVSPKEGYAHPCDSAPGTILARHHVKNAGDAPSGQPDEYIVRQSHGAEQRTLFKERKKPFSLIYIQFLHTLTTKNGTE